jgi:hypothetical protein
MAKIKKMIGSGIINASPFGYLLGDVMEATVYGSGSNSRLLKSDGVMSVGVVGVVVGINNQYIELYDVTTNMLYVRYEGSKHQYLKLISRGEYIADTLIKTDKKMKTQKPVYHTFDLGERQITLCVKNRGGHSVSVGYAVKVATDTFDETLSERISAGRADSKARLENDTISPTYQNTRVFKAIAQVWERRITNNPTRYIKGIKVIEKKD